MLALLLAIGLTGLGMKYVAPTDIVALKAFFLGLMYFDWQPCRRTPCCCTAPAAGSPADDRVPVQQVAARTRRILQPDAKPGR